MTKPSATQPNQPPEVPNQSAGAAATTVPGRALIVSAHPDDPEFGAGGTLAKWTAAGSTVAIVIVTDGSKGSSDRSMTSDRLVPLRQAEERAAAARLGVQDVTFLGFPDGATMPDLALRHAITREIRRFRPDLIITHDPATLYWDQYINHPDHRAVGQAALDAIFPTARDHLNAPEHLAEGLEPHIVPVVYLTGSQAPDTWEDITPTLETKLAALREHKSQFTDLDAMAGRVRERSRGVAEGHGMEYAEAFKKIAFQ